MSEILDPELDRMYNSNVRCPYCRAKILKYTTTCSRCGIHKRQIYEASNLEAKEIIKNRTGKKIFLMRRRPNDVSFTRMAVKTIFTGYFGLHCFFTGRRIRAWFMLVCGIIGLISLTVFVMPPMSDFRNVFSDIEIMDGVAMIFPFDIFFMVDFIMWGFDIFAVVFGQFRYPVRLGDSPNQTSKDAHKPGTAKKSFAEYINKMSNKKSSSEAQNA